MMGGLLGGGLMGLMGMMSFLGEMMMTMFGSMLEAMQQFFDQKMA